MDERDRIFSLRTSGDDELRREVESLLDCDDDSKLAIESVIQNAAEAVKADPVDGQRIGAYRLVRKIGQGGMGTVFLAVRADDQYRKQVAIKLMRRGMENPQAVERFRHERQILASLEHPYIARLLDGGSAKLGGLYEETPYLVLEFVQGESIFNYCDQHELGIRDRCRLYLKVCEAVSYAHRNLVVHRDLKPGNILITPDGSPRLLDFGIAKLLDESSAIDSNPVTVMGTQLTPEYASPEQVRGDRITTAADIYSLGAILYELLSGVMAHQLHGRGMSELERVICNTDPPRLSEAAPALKSTLHGDLDAIVAMALRKEPERRYPSVEKLILDLTNYLDGLPVIARQGNFAYMAGKYVRRNRAVIAASVFVSAALIGGAVFSGLQAIRASREQVKAEVSRRNAEQQTIEAQRQRAIAEEQRHETERQHEQAEQQRAVADRRFEQVRQLAGKFLTDFHDSIEKLPGSTPARKMVVQTGLDYYDKLIPEASGNTELLKEIARGYDRLGDVQGNPYYGNLGDVKGALASYQKALSIRARVADTSPEFMSDRILGNVRIAQVMGIQNDLKGASKYLTDALNLGKQKPAGASVHVRAAMIKAYANYGDLKTREAVHSQAIEPYLAMLALAKQLVKDAPENRARQADLSLAYLKLGDVYGRLERPDEALFYLRTAVDWYRKLSAANPNDSRQARLLFISYNLIGRVLKSRAGREYGKPGEVRGYLEAAVQLGNKLAIGDPDNRTALMDVATAESALGEWLRIEKDFDAAVAAFRRSVAAAEKLNRSSVQVAGNQDALIQGYQRLAEGLMEKSQYQDALGYLDRAAGYLSIVEKAMPGSMRIIRRQTELMQTRAEIYMAQKKWDDAGKLLASILSIFDEKMKLDPQNDFYKNERPGLLSQLAECQAGAGRFDLAEKSVQHVLDAYRNIEAARPLVKPELEARAELQTKFAQWKRQSELAAAAKK